MNKKDLAEALSAKTGRTKAESKEFIDAFISTVINTVRRGRTIKLVGFGIFERRFLAVRKARNPATNEIETFPSKRFPKFVPGKTFKTAVAESGEKKTKSSEKAEPKKKAKSAAKGGPKKTAKEK